VTPTLVSKTTSTMATTSTRVAKRIMIIILSIVVVVVDRCVEPKRHLVGRTPQQKSSSRHLRTQKASTVASPATAASCPIRAVHARVRHAALLHRPRTLKPHRVTQLMYHFGDFHHHMIRACHVAKGLPYDASCHFRNLVSACRRGTFSQLIQKLFIMRYSSAK